jgi:hypothetical protein
MTLNMNDDHLVSIAQLREFAKLSNSATLKVIVVRSKHMIG